MKLEPKLDYKCEHCGKGESKHRAFGKECPISISQFSKIQHFKSTDKPTPQSRREVNKHLEMEARREEHKRLQEIERNKVRAMTFEELVTATVELLTKETGLGIIDEDERPWSKKIVLTTLGGKIRLGYTSVSKYSNGKYSVGGISTGCFMSNHSDSDIQNVMSPLFRELEERANKEKK